MQQGDREPPSPLQEQYNIIHRHRDPSISIMTTSTTQAMPSPYLHQHHHNCHAGVTGNKEQAYSAGGGDNRSTSPTVVVSANIHVKEDTAMSPAPTMASSNSPASSPVSPGYHHPNPAQHTYSRQTSSSAQYPSQHVTFIGGSSHHSSSSNLHPGQDPLSPQSAPVVSSAWPTFPTPTDPNSAASTPMTVPSEIHTKSGGGGTIPYFPSIKSSGSLSSKNSTKSITVTGKKKHMTKATSGCSISNISETTTTTVVTIERGGGGGAPVPVRRQKRLERNRESARLSRRRRKQYLEVLEERVAKLSLDTDRGRREHASKAIDTVMSKRRQVLQRALGGDGDAAAHDGDGQMMNDLERSLWLLDGPLSRTCDEFLILSSFFTQQLKSFALPSHTKFVLWLTLQGDTYYRGGRAASERLSAARIGERMLASGNDKAAPTNSMWPLVCNEVGLSYDQEERVRNYQRTMILQDPNTWLDRHTARSSSLLMESFHDSLGSTAQVLGARDARGAKRILTPTQRIKLLAWAEKNAHRIKDRLGARRKGLLQQKEQQQQPMDTNEGDVASERSCNNRYEVKGDQHMAANLYILNHKLQQVLKDFAFRAPAMVTPATLKKLSRRPSFESLGQQKDAEGRSLCREDSFASSGSLKNSTSMLSLAGVEDQEKATPTNQITPEDGEQAAAPTVDRVLGFVKPIIPPIEPPVVAEDFEPTPSMSAPLTVAHGSTPVLQYQAAPQATGYAVHDAPPPQQTMVLPAPTPVSHYVMHAQGQEHVPMQQYQYVPPVASQQHPVAPAHQATQHPPPQYEQSYQQHQIQYYPPTQQQHTQPMPAPMHYNSQPAPASTSAPIQPAHGPAFQPAPVPQQQHASHHVRQSSFLPPHLNVVAEDLFPTGEAAADDFFVSLMDDEEWAIGGGVYMDTTH